MIQFNATGPSFAKVKIACIRAAKGNARKYRSALVLFEWNPITLYFDISEKLASYFSKTFMQWSSRQRYCLFPSCSLAQRFLLDASPEHRVGEKGPFTSWRR